MKIKDSEGRIWNRAYGNARVCQIVPSILRALKLGAGITPDLPMIYCLDEFRTGALVPVMQGRSRTSLPCFVVTNEQTMELRRVRVFRDYLVGELRKIFRSYGEKAAR